MKNNLRVRLFACGLILLHLLTFPTITFASDFEDDMVSIGSSDFGGGSIGSDNMGGFGGWGYDSPGNFYNSSGPGVKFEDFNPNVDTLPDLTYGPQDYSTSGYDFGTFSTMEVSPNTDYGTIEPAFSYNTPDTAPAVMPAVDSSLNDFSFASDIEDVAGDPIQPTAPNTDLIDTLRLGPALTNSRVNVAAPAPQTVAPNPSTNAPLLSLSPNTLFDIGSGTNSIAGSMTTMDMNIGSNSFQPAAGTGLYEFRDAALGGRPDTNSLSWSPVPAATGSVDTLSPSIFDTNAVAQLPAPTNVPGFSVESSGINLGQFAPPLTGGAGDYATTAANYLGTNLVVDLAGANPAGSGVNLDSFSPGPGPGIGAGQAAFDAFSTGTASLFQPTNIAPLAVTEPQPAGTNVVASGSVEAFLVQGGIAGLGGQWPSGLTAQEIPAPSVPQIDFQDPEWTMGTLPTIQEAGGVGTKYELPGPDFAGPVMPMQGTQYELPGLDYAGPVMPRPEAYTATVSANLDYNPDDIMANLHPEMFGPAAVPEIPKAPEVARADAPIEGMIGDSPWDFPEPQALETPKPIEPVIPVETPALATPEPARISHLDIARQIASETGRPVFIDDGQKQAVYPDGTIGANKPYGSNAAIVSTNDAGNISVIFKDPKTNKSVTTEIDSGGNLLTSTMDSNIPNKSYLLMGIKEHPVADILVNAGQGAGQAAGIVQVPAAPDASVATVTKGGPTLYNHATQAQLNYAKKNNLLLESGTGPYKAPESAGGGWTFATKEPMPTNIAPIPDWGSTSTLAPAVPAAPIASTPATPAAIAPAPTAIASAPQQEPPMGWDMPFEPPEANPVAPAPVMKEWVAKKATKDQMDELHKNGIATHSVNNQDGTWTLRFQATEQKIEGAESQTGMSTYVQPVPTPVAANTGRTLIVRPAQDFIRPAAAGPAANPSPAITAGDHKDHHHAAAPVKAAAPDRPVRTAGTKETAFTIPPERQVPIGTRTDIKIGATPSDVAKAVKDGTFIRIDRTGPGVGVLVTEDKTQRSRPVKQHKR